MKLPARSTVLWITAPFVIVGAVVALALSTNGPHKSSATAERGPRVSALLLVAREPPRNLPETQPKAADPVEFEDFKRTQAALIRSHLVLNAALNAKGVGQLPTVKAQA